MFLVCFLCSPHALVLSWNPGSLEFQVKSFFLDPRTSEPQSSKVSLVPHVQWPRNPEIPEFWGAFFWRSDTNEPRTLKPRSSGLAFLIYHRPQNPRVLRSILLSSSYLRMSSAPNLRPQNPGVLNWASNIKPKTQEPWSSGPICNPSSLEPWNPEVLDLLVLKLIYPGTPEFWGHFSKRELSISEPQSPKVNEFFHVLYKNLTLVSFLQIQAIRWTQLLVREAKTLTDFLQPWSTITKGKFMFQN